MHICTVYCVGKLLLEHNNFGTIISKLPAQTVLFEVGVTRHVKLNSTFHTSDYILAIISVYNISIHIYIHYIQ